jgi:hypothetical protein
MMDFSKIKVCDIRNYDQNKSELATKKKVEIDKKQIIDEIKEKKKDKIIKQHEAEEEHITNQDKKVKSVKKIISMSNTDKPLLDRQKKISKLLDKYYIKYEELDF